VSCWYKERKEEKDGVGKRKKRKGREKKGREVREEKNITILQRGIRKFKNNKERNRGLALTFPSQDLWMPHGHSSTCYCVNI
jgi:hypothetical protein